MTKIQIVNDAYETPDVSVREYETLDEAQAMCARINRWPANQYRGPMARVLYSDGDESRIAEIIEESHGAVGPREAADILGL